MSRWSILTCVLALAPLACSAGSPFFGGSAANDNCEREVKERILSRNEGAENIEFQRAGRDGDVRTGYGRWRRSNGEHVQFRYECRYADRNNRLTAAGFEIVNEGDGWWSGGGPGRGDHGDAEMQRECRAAVRREMERQFPNSSNVDLQGERSGRGVFTGGEGRRRTLSWSCDWDASRGRVNDVDVSIGD
jgi:hypothetical protein